MSEQRTFISIKYAFSADELRELGEQLAREASGVFDLERKKSARAAEITALLKQAKKPFVICGAQAPRGAPLFPALDLPGYLLKISQQHAV